MVRRLLAIGSVLLACSRKDGPPSPDAAAPSAMLPIAPSATTTPNERVRSAPPIPPEEATRMKTTRLEDDPALVAASDALRKHFGGPIPRELWVQAADRPEGRGRALLVGDATKPPPGEPFAIVVDATGALAWTKDRPTAGIPAPIGPLAIAAGPSGRVALAVCNPPTTRVALRIWDDDGAPFADFDAMDMETCTAVSLLYWPRRGFVIVATRESSTKAQLVSENGALTWRRGIDVGARSVTGAPASIAADSEDSFVLVQYGALSAEPGARPHALAFRYDRQGAPLWSSPVDLGVQPVDRIDDRIVLARPKAGQVRATLSKSHVVDVTSNGTVARR